MRKIIFVLSLILFLSGDCKPANLTNMCDVKSDAFWYSTLIRFVSGDRSPSCLPSFAFEELWGVFMPSGGSPGATVYSIANYQNQIIIGGDFLYAGPSTGGAVYLDSQFGTLVSHRVCPYLKVVGVTNVAISDGAGGFYLGGEIFSVQGIEVSGPVHILSGCQLDRNFKVPEDFSRTVYCLLLVGERLYVGGNFVGWGSASYNHLVALNRFTGDLDLNFNSSSTNNIVHDIVTDGNHLYVGGDFTNIGGAAKTGLARLDLSTGGNDGSFPAQLPGGSYAADLELGTDANGTPVLYVVGSGGAPYNSASSYFLDGSQTTWNPLPNNQINRVAQFQDTVYLGGSFSLINGGIPGSNLVGVDSSVGITKINNYAIANPVTSIEIIDQIMYLSGEFTSVKGVPRRYAAAVSLIDQTVTAFDPSFDSGIGNPGASFTSAGNGTLFMTTMRTTVNIKPRRNFAVFDELTGYPFESPNIDFLVKALYVHENYLFVGGSFTNIGGIPRTAFAILDLPSYQVNPKSISVVGAGTPEIRAFAKDESQLYIGTSDVTSFGGSSRMGAMAIRLSDLNVSDWNPNLAGTGESLLPIKDLLFVGGLYSGMNGDGTTTNYHAVDKMNGNKRGVPSTIVFPNSGVYAQSTFGNQIFLGGQFSNIGGDVEFSRFAIYDTTEQKYVTPSPVKTNNFVYTLNVSPDGKLVLGGSFDEVNGEPNRYSFVYYDINTKTLSPWNSNINSTVFSSLYKNGRFYVGGEFTIAHKKSCGGFTVTSLNE
ncbi:hypothetical protein P3G55_00750 [Leptospira sp. 96542]|nr:hypothetical protein [Leptospira sp. 96542]